MEVENKLSEIFTEKSKYSDESGLPKELENTVQKLLKREGFIDYEIKTRKICTEGGNYLAELYEVDIVGITSIGPKTLHLFIKNTLNGALFENFIPISQVYDNEVFVYKELSRIYNELQEKAEIPESERYKMIKCYSETNTKTIIMDNVTKDGFRTLYRMDSVPLSFAELSVKNLARFHALSYVLEKERPDFYEKKIKSLKYPNSFNEEMEAFTLKTANMTYNVLDDAAKERFKKCVPTLTKRMKDYIENLDTTMKCCLCHGDFRANNILAKSEEGIVKEVIPVDYQLIHYSCPLNDFLYFIFGATDQNFRKNYLEQLKELYYSTMKDFMKYFDIEIESIVSKEAFDKEYKQRLDFGLIMSVMLTPFLFVLESDIPDFSTQSPDSINFTTDTRFDTRIREVIDDFIQWGYL